MNSDDSVIQRAGFLLQDVLSYGEWRFLAGVRGDAHFSMDNNYAFAWSPRFGITRMIGERVACSPMPPALRHPISATRMRITRS